MMNQKHDNGKLSIVAAIIQLIFSVALYIISYNIEPAISAHLMVQTANFLLISTFIASISFIHSYMQRLANEEVEENKKIDKSGTLFENEIDDLSGRYQNSNKQFNKIILPIIVIFVSVIELALCYSVLSLEKSHSHVILPDNLNPLLISASVLITFSCSLFLLGKYCLGIAEGNKNIYIIPVSSYLIFCSILCLISGVASLLFYWRFDNIERWGTWLTCGLAIIIAIERFFFFIIETYRPQRIDKVNLPLYNSRLLRLINQPRRLVANLTEVIEYQFGIKISEQWMQNFCTRILIPYLFIQSITLALLTCITFVHPSETALKESMGSTKLEELSPGLYLNYPWPINRIHKIPTQKIYTTSTGAIPTGKSQNDHEENMNIVLWDNEAFNKNVFLAGSNMSDTHDTNQKTRILDVNLASASINVHYKIEIPIEYFSTHKTNDKLLNLLSKQILNRYILSHNFYELLKCNFSDLSKYLKLEIQSTVNARKLGYTITHVDVNYIQPPPDVSISFQQLISTQQARISQQLRAQNYAIQTMAEADSETNRIVKQAESDTILRTSLAEVEMNNFLKQYKIYKKYPELYRIRSTMDNLEEWLRDVRKIITNSKSTREVINLELKNSKADILDVSVE